MTIVDNSLTSSEDTSDLVHFVYSFTSLAVIWFIHFLFGLIHTHCLNTFFCTLHAFTHFPQIGLQLPLSYIVLLLMYVFMVYLSTNYVFSPFTILYNYLFSHKHIFIVGTKPFLTEFETARWALHAWWWMEQQKWRVVCKERYSERIPGCIQSYANVYWASVNNCIPTKKMYMLSV